jgi:predicted DNA-binding transcriptional regulator AlpA
MKLVETLKNRTGALKVAEIAKLLGVTPQHIYKMAASGGIPSFPLCASIPTTSLCGSNENRPLPLREELVHPEQPRDSAD